MTAEEAALFFDDRKLHEIAVHASSEKWPPVQVFVERLLRLLEAILREGRESGEFERKTPLDETARSIYYAFLPFIDPIFFERSLDLPPEAHAEVTALVLRSLAP